MEIIPIPPRRRSSAIDEPIESGEIDGSRRSLIIRSSQSQPIVQPPMEMPVGTIVPPFHSGPIALPQPVKKPMFAVWLGLAVIAALAALVVPMLAKPAATAGAPNLEPIAALIGATIDGDARAAQTRIDAVATTPMLRAAIETDAQTLADMARDKDLLFPVKAGETLEVFQITDKRASMLRVPASAGAIESVAPGKVLLVSRLDGIAIVVAAKVASQSDITGEVALVVPVDLSAVKQRLAAVVDEGIVMGLAMPVVVVKSTGVKGKVVTIPIATQVSDVKLSLSAIVQPSNAAGSSLAAVRIGGFGLAGLFFVLFLVALRRR
jgi:hypothetical protein